MSAFVVDKHLSHDQYDTTYFVTRLLLGAPFLIAIIPAVVVQITSPRATDAAAVAAREHDRITGGGIG